MNKKLNDVQGKLQTGNDKYEVRAGQSIELLKQLHILTNEGKMNQDSRRKLKQIYHLYQFIEPLLTTIKKEQSNINLVDLGAGKAYLGFILYDLFFKQLQDTSHIYSIETRNELVGKSQDLAAKLDFLNMSFLNSSIIQSISSKYLPKNVDIVTALHACDTATDDAINFAINKKAKFIVLVPCCQAEVAALLNKSLARGLLAEIWRRPIHAREFGSHITNVLRALCLEAHGYKVMVTELTGWEHSLKNELIVASYTGIIKEHAINSIDEILNTLGLKQLKSRFFNII